MLATFISILFTLLTSAHSYDKLSETGLYSDIAKKTIAKENRYYSPQYPLWTDGAIKKRWIYIPEGKQIDTSDMNKWIFPIGTKIWKEFAFESEDGPKVTRVETRLIEKNNHGNWIYYTYHWNADESDADLVPDAGLADVYQIDSKTTFDIPSKRQCIACHGFDNRAVQSFQAIQLSPERDGMAPHQDNSIPNPLTLKEMMAEGLMTHNPNVWPKIPNDNLNPLQKTVFGYMVGNCASCHRPGGLADRTGFFTDFDVKAKDFTQLPAYKTGVDEHTVFFVIPGVDPTDSYRLRPSKIEHSAVAYRLKNRNSRPMPPFGYKITDQEGVRLVEDYLRNFIK